VSKSEELFAAIAAGETDRVREAIASDAILVDARNASGHSAVLEATYRGRNEIVRLLIDRGARLDLFEAAATGTQDRLEQLLHLDRTTVNSYSADGWTPLHLAVFFGRLNIVHVLLKSGANVDAISKNGERLSPLHSALANPNNAAIAEILLDAGADPNAVQEQGYTPLHYAAYNGLERVVRMLLSRSAATAGRTKEGKTAYDLSVERGHTAIASLLKPN
jgi:ankyrin repeat protein